MKMKVFLFFFKGVYSIKASSCIDFILASKATIAKSVHSTVISLLALDHRKPKILSPILSLDTFDFKKIDCVLKIST